MPADQFFTDWVTGDIITADKLNTMKNEVQPYLGYTPLNKAGDTWTGDLIGGNLYASRYLGITGDINEAKWIMHTGDYSTYFYSDNNNTSALPGASNQTIFGRTYRAKAAFRPEGHLDIAGEYRGRYDHQNRFVISEYAPQSVNLSPGGITDLAIARINVPADRSLYIRRVRYRLSDPLRVRISTSQTTWTASSADMDADVDSSIFSGSGTTDLNIRVTNVGSSNQTLLYAQGVWVEFEIR